MLSRTEFAVTRRGMLGPKIAALLRSTMACYPYPRQELGNDRPGADPAKFPGLERTAPHVSTCCRRRVVLSRLIFPARPNS
jgi:hypothetical protein